MVLPPPAADDAPGPASPGWLRRLKVALGLSRAGLLVLVDHARPERLGELVRALLPLAPELDVHTEAHRLAEARPGSTLVLVPRAEDADWLNLNRPLFASRALRVVLFCSREVSVALSRGAVDFLDWISLRLACPEGPAPYAVAGLRRALAARVPGIVWTGGDLEASFAAARPRRALRRVSAARPYEELVAEVQAGGHRDWLAWTEVDGDFRLRRVRWALAEARHRTRTLLLEPAVHSPGWWEVHGRAVEPKEACARLQRAGAKQPGRLAALVDLEPEAVELLCGLLERGVGERTLEEEILKGTDPGANVGRMAAEHGLVAGKELVLGRAPPPAIRAFAAEQDRMQPTLPPLEGIETSDRARRRILHDLGYALYQQGRYAEAEEFLWQSLALTKQAFGPQHPNYGTSLHVLAMLLSRRGRFAEAEELLRQSLAVVEQRVGPQHPDYGSSLHELARVLENQGRYTEAEELLRQSLALKEQALGPSHPSLCPTLANLGFNLAKQERPQQGEPFLQRSVDIAQQTWGPQHPETAQSFNLLAHVQAALRKPEAATTAQKAMDALLNSLGPEHPITKQALPGLLLILAGQG